jgi:hypothetical protein
METAKRSRQCLSLLQNILHTLIKKNVPDCQREKKIHMQTFETKREAHLKS